MSRSVVTIVGARPQFIKAAPVSQALSRAGLREVLVHTGQHFDAMMSDVFFEELGIPRPAYSLEVNSLGHGAMTGRMLEKVEEVLLREKPDWVLIYGDTNSTLAGALADKFDRRRVMVVCDLLRCGLFVSIPLVGKLWWLIVATLLIEMCALFWIPAKDAAVPNLLRRPDQVETANQLALVMTYGVSVITASGLGMPRPTASLSVRFRVSTTRESPSKWPTEAPMYWRTPSSGRSLRSSGMIRVSCSIS